MAAAIILLGAVCALFLLGEGPYSKSRTTGVYVGSPDILKLPYRPQRTTWMLGDLVRRLRFGLCGPCYGCLNGALWGLLAGLTKSTDHPNKTSPPP